MPAQTVWINVCSMHKGRMQILIYQHIDLQKIELITRSSVEYQLSLKVASFQAAAYSGKQRTVINHNILYMYISKGC